MNISKRRFPIFMPLVILSDFPALASTSMQQGRHAACHAFGYPDRTDTSLLPYGIYAIPEISMVGRNEEELTQADIPVWSRHRPV